MDHSVGDVVAVTGAAGFLGLKVVELFLKRGSNIQEIRGLDIAPQPPSLFLQIANSGKLRYTRGDVCNYDEVKAALKGATVVVHTAAIVDINQPSEVLMNEVNIRGTENIIRACLECNVTRIVYTSTADVALGWSDNNDLNEATPVSGDEVSDFLFGQYAFTKMKGEKKVLEANGSRCANGSALVSCSLRPTVMYGEGDKVFVPNVIKSAKSQFGYLPRMGDGNAKFQLCYVYNAAWAHIVATECLQTHPSLVGGKSFFVGDDTPLDNFFNSVEPFLLGTGCKLVDIYIPYSVLISLAIFLECIAWILKPFYHLSSSFTRSTVFSVCRGATFRWIKAKEELGYQPIFSYQESKNNTIQYLVERFVMKT